MNMFEKILKWFRSVPKTGLLLDEQYRDQRDFVLGSITEYKPKHIRYEIPFQWIKDQKGQNSCVTESGATQKENDETVELCPQDMATYLKSVGLMFRKGTSLSYFQNALRERGIAEKQFYPNIYSVSWEEFANPKRLTEEIKQNAAEHKSKSYFYTQDIHTVLAMLDEGRIGQTGGQWYTGYNVNGGFSSPFILSYAKDSIVGGHAWAIIGYDTDYDGKKVLVCLNSYVPQYGYGGRMFVQFSDFANICSAGVYFNVDLDKNVLGWLSIHNKHAVLEKNGNKVYLIESDKKRHIPDEAIMLMLGFTPQSIIHDKENILPEVKDGKPITLEDVPTDNVSRMRYFLEHNKDKAFLQDRYAQYFPDLF